MNRNAAQACSSGQAKEERDRILLEQLPQVRYLARRIHDRLPRHVPLEDHDPCRGDRADRCPEQI